MGDRVLCDFTVEGDPVPKGRPRTDSRSHRTYTPARTQDAQDAMAWEFKMHCPRGNPATGPVTVTLRFRCATRRRVDIDNLAKLVLDAGNGIIYADDFQVTTLIVYADHGCADPGTDVRIEEAP